MSYQANDSVKRSGFDLLQNVGFDVNMCKGYPVLHARITDYKGTGYRTACCWIQTITGSYYTDLDSKTESYQSVDIDVSPLLKKAGIPFFAYGYLPEVYDAPCNNLGIAPKLKWVADTFLTTMPSPINNNVIGYLLGFRWGYIEYDDSGKRKVEMLPLEITDATVWNNFIPKLQGDFPGFAFEEQKDESVRQIG